MNLQKFYELGARKVLVLSTGPLGCVPAERATRSINGDCAPQLQQASAFFNTGLRSIIDQLNNQYSAQIYTMGNSFPPNQDLFSNPQAYGNALISKDFSDYQSLGLNSRWYSTR